MGAANAFLHLDANTAKPAAPFTEKAAAAYLAVSISTFRRWRASGLGPEYFQVGNIIRYSQAALEEFKEKNTRRVL
jgi:hypothetical protein